jgi:hypothetical protein
MYATMSSLTWENRHCRKLLSTKQQATGESTAHMRHKCCVRVAWWVGIGGGGRVGGVGGVLCVVERRNLHTRFGWRFMIKFNSEDIIY